MYNFGNPTPTVPAGGPIYMGANANPNTMNTYPFAGQGQAAFPEGGAGVKNEIDVGVGGSSAVILMTVLHLGVLVGMFSYGVVLNSLPNFSALIYLLIAILCYTIIIGCYYLDYQMPSVVLTTILPWMYTITLIVLLVIATVLVHPKQPFSKRSERVGNKKKEKNNVSNQYTNQNNGVPDQNKGTLNNNAKEDTDSDGIESKNTHYKDTKKSVSSQDNNEGEKF